MSHSSSPSLSPHSPSLSINLSSILPDSILLTPTILQKLKYFASNHSNQNQELLFNATLSKEWNGKEDVQRVLLGISNENGTVPVKILWRPSLDHMDFDNENERDPWVERTFKYCHCAKRVDFGRFLPVQMQVSFEEGPDSDEASVCQMHLSGELILPSVCHKLYDLRSTSLPSAPFSAKSLRIASNTLSHFLMRTNRAQQVASGYVAVHQQQHSNVRQKLSQLVTVYKEDDPVVPQTQLDGIWISGLDMPLHKHKEYLWAALTRYRHSRITRRDHSRFLVVVFPQNTPSDAQFYCCQSYLPDGEESGDSDNYSIYPCNASVPVTPDDLGASILMKFENMQDEDLSADVAIGVAPPSTQGEHHDMYETEQNYASHQQHRRASDLSSSRHPSPPNAVRLDPSSPLHHSQNQTSHHTEKSSPTHSDNSAQLQQMCSEQKQQSQLLNQLLGHIRELQSELRGVKLQLSNQCEQNNQVNLHLSHLKGILHSNEERNSHNTSRSSIQMRSTAVETDEAQEHTPIKQRSSIGGVPTLASNQSNSGRNASPHSTISPAMEQQSHYNNMMHQHMHPQFQAPHQYMNGSAYNGFPGQMQHGGYPGAYYAPPGPGMFSSHDSYDAQQRYFAQQIQQHRLSTPQSTGSSPMYAGGQPMHQMSSYSHQYSPSPHMQSSTEHEAYDPSPSAQQSQYQGNGQENVSSQQQESHKETAVHVHQDDEPVTSPSKRQNSSYHVVDSYEPLQSPQKPRYAVMKSPKNKKGAPSETSQAEKENMRPTNQSPSRRDSRKNPLLTPKNQKSRRLHDANEQESEYDASIQIPSLIVSQKNTDSPSPGKLSKTEQYMSRPPLSAKKSNVNSSGNLSPATPAVRKSRSERSSQLSSSGGSPFLSNDDTMPRIDFNPDDDDDDSTTLGEHTLTPMSSNYTMDLDDSNWLTPGAKNYLNRHKLNTFSPDSTVSPAHDRRLKLDR